MIEYKDNLTGINGESLKGFFVNWPAPPDQEKLMQILQNSEYIVLAMDNNKVIGFINAISDKVLSAYIPLLEVLPEYKNNGIGSELVKKMLDKLKNYYMVDICCDEELESFYRKFDMRTVKGMIKRNYNKLTL